MNVVEYIREQDRQEYRDFCMQQIHRFSQPAVNEVWHYTNADGLIGIISTGQIWSTQVSCLNDCLEQRYFRSLVHEAVKVMRAKNTDADLSVILRVADEALAASSNFVMEEHFVACFSEVEDDLGQWRGYGGGECGYAIGFRFNDIQDILIARQNAFLLPMHYEDNEHQSFVDEVMRMAQQYFINGIQRKLPDIERWAQEFFAAFAWELNFFSSIIKHPKFCAEKERRIIIFLQPDEYKKMEFRQKRTLLARHLPINLTVKEMLPITRVYVGPGPGQRVSQVSVSYLLTKYGYNDIPVELSKVPYRVP